jgi:hypothetical protein
MLKFSGAAKSNTLNLRQFRDNTMGIDRPGPHYFTLFRMGEDVCAKCGKPRAEHPKRKA